MKKNNAMTVDEIIKACDGELCSGERRTEVTGISIDSRTIKDGEIFLAIKGKKYDGHSFTGDALKKKAVGVIVCSGGACFALVQPGKVVIRVKNTLSALQSIAGRYRDKFTLSVVAITGSNGKTTTKEMLTSILSQRFNTVKSQASFNNEIGLPLTLLQITSLHEVCILEIGMSRKGEIRCLANIAKPDTGIITNIGPAHLGSFRNLGEVARAKAELLEVIDGTCILNADDEHFEMLKEKCSGKVVTFGLDNAADFRADSPREGSSGETIFSVNGKLEIKLPVAGRHNVYNAISAIAGASCFDIDEECIRRGLENFSPLAGRCEVKECGGVAVIDDTYNANPESMKCAIEFLACRFGRRKILVIADMLELGEHAAESHESIGRLIAQSDIDILFTTGNFAKITAEAAVKEGMKKVFSCESKQGLVKKVLSELKQYDTILVKGSRATGMEQVVDAILSLPMAT